MTKEEFEKSWLEKSGLPGKLSDYGLEVAECDCDYEGCKGWQVRTKVEEQVKDRG